MRPVNIFGRLKSNYYEILGVKANAESFQIARAIIDLLSVCKPDLVPAHQKDIATTCTRWLYKISDTLYSTPAKRAYGESLASLRSSADEIESDALGVEAEAFIANRKELLLEKQKLKEEYAYVRFESDNYLATAYTDALQ